MRFPTRCLSIREYCTVEPFGDRFHDLCRRLLVHEFVRFFLIEDVIDCIVLFVINFILFSLKRERTSVCVSLEQSASSLFDNNNCSSTTQAQYDVLLLFLDIKRGGQIDINENDVVYIKRVLPVFAKISCSHQ